MEVAVHAHKSKVTIQEDHRVEVQLPDDFPEGPAEIIVLTSRPAGGARAGSAQSARQRTLAALAELRSAQLTPEEEEVLDGFETFRREHPVRFASLKDED
jgi:hypothetical protein